MIFNHGGGEYSGAAPFFIAQKLPLPKLLCSFGLTKTPIMLDQAQRMIYSLCGQSFGTDGTYTLYSFGEVAGVSVEFSCRADITDDTVCADSVHDFQIIEAYPLNVEGDRWAGGFWSDAVAAYIILNTDAGRELIESPCQADFVN